LFNATTLSDDINNNQVVTAENTKFNKVDHNNESCSPLDGTMNTSSHNASNSDFLSPPNNQFLSPVSAAANRNTAFTLRRNTSFNVDELKELKNALSRKNSFISYFDDRQNVPDVTVANLKEAVDYIVKSIKEN
jgi:hypothetical protein